MPHDSERHAQHDPLLVVSLAADDIAGADRDRATALIAECPDCARLHDDLLVIARATAALPAPARPRDFKLTREDAKRLQPGGWRRFAAGFASSRLLVSRQIGVGLTTIGLAGLLLSTLSSMPFGMATSGAASLAARDAAGQAAAPVASSAEGGGSKAPGAASSNRYGSDLTDGSTAGSASGSASAAAGPSASAAALAPVPGSTKTLTGQGQGGGAVENTDGRNLAPITSEPAPSSVPLLPIVSVLLVLAGLILLIARRVARRMIAG